MLETAGPAPPRDCPQLHRFPAQGLWVHPFSASEMVEGRDYPGAVVSSRRAEGTPGR